MECALRNARRSVVEAWRYTFLRGISRSGRPSIMHKRGADVLHDPWYNKGTAAPATERDRLGLRGLLPPRVMTFQQQIDRFMSDFKSLEHSAKDGPHEIGALAKWRILNRLHDRNETLYYRILIDNITQFAPIIYTPTVGLVCQNYSGLFRRPRGMYFSAADRGEMVSMVYNWPAEQVDIIVVTDGSRILGLGDLGVQGIGIPIGKLDLYVAAAGFNPQRVLPVMIDVGTNNKKMRDDPLYLGLQQPRLEGEDYLAVIDEFMEGVFTRWPHVIVQFEDFQSKWAYKLLQRYRTHYRMFNDDVQGTAGVALAGLFGAVRAQGKPLSELAEAKIVVVGAGSAGLGVLHMTRKAIAQMLGKTPEAKLQSTRNLYLVDKLGLVTKARKDVDPDARPFARDEQEMEEGSSLLEVVKKVKPDMLVGLSGVGGIFTPEILQEMRKSSYKRPAIFPMSNPTMNAECTAEQAFTHVGEHIIFASGSPFDNVDLGGGKVGHVNQGNNMYLFPGIGLGTLLCGARMITDRMLNAAAERLASYMSEENIKAGRIYPPISSIRDISKEVAIAVLKTAVAEDLAEGFRDISTRELQQMSEEEIVEYVEGSMWFPEYSPLIYEQHY